VGKMGRKQQNGGQQQYKNNSLYDEEEDERVTIITIPVSEEGDEDVYNAVMNVEEFLAEHNIRVEENENSEDAVSNDSTEDIKPFQRPSIIVSPKKVTQQHINTSANLYKESKKAIAEREREEKRRKLEEQSEFSPEDLSLATVPGMEFDPSQRSFDLEELRPQPIIKKRSKLFVNDGQKDDKYWEKREKNNNAARRSREARRLKENQIALRVAHLERENGSIKQVLNSAQFDVTKLTNERDLLKRKLSHFE